MIPQERNLLIAETMGLKIKEFVNHPDFGNGLYIVTEQYFIDPIKWNPSENAEQREMIKAKLREWGCGYLGGYNKSEKYFWFSILYPEKSSLEVLKIKNKTSESEAFLEAVGIVIRLSGSFV